MPRKKTRKQVKTQAQRSKLDVGTVRRSDGRFAYRIYGDSWAIGGAEGIGSYASPSGAKKAGQARANKIEARCQKTAN